MNDRKALILATLIERGRLKETEIVKITGIPRSPVRRALESLEPLAYRDAEHYWNVQRGTKVAVLRPKRFGLFQWLERRRQVQEAKDLTILDLWAETWQAWEDQREQSGADWIVDHLERRLADIYNEGENKPESPQ